VLGVAATIVGGWLMLTVLLAADVGSKRPKMRPAYGVAAVAAAVLIAAGVFWNFTGGLGADMVFDRRSGLFRGRCWTRRGWRRGVTAPLADIASLQICCRHIQEQDEESYQSYELNIVLSNPPGERLGLGSHGDAKEVQEDAARLAEFLGCGVLVDCPGLRPFPSQPRLRQPR
jgi:hypothetical protein